MFETLARATLKINCGNSTGSGFHFLNEKIIITNCHVIMEAVMKGQSITAVTEEKDIYELKLLSYSSPNEFDFAILQLSGELKRERTILQPKIQNYLKRGTEICFSGYPHGINDLLVHRAVISGPFANHGFYIDGSVNGGNSGGPIIDNSDGTVIGVVTQRRFLGAIEAKNIEQRSEELKQYCNSIAGRGSVQLMGIDFGQFAQLMAESFLLSQKIIQSNANTGIGIGFKIEYVVEECKRLNLL
ncbi:S1 family peptidase [Sphingobacterium multivorum]|uniref:S1 family peptidase n=1 Tax=Sphingobacterium TaxID=28453 RepID=UPI00289F2FC2|nr:serine protease [Sphingobacterium multivorum]